MAKGALTKLQKLYLNDNRLHTVASDAFANLASLHSLQLNRNDLEGELDPRALRPLAGLSTLGIGHNRIERVAPDTFKGCTQVSGMTCFTK